MNKVHDLKTWPEYFQAVRRGDKTFEIRKNDREYEVGDILRLREWEPRKEDYTGEMIYAYVSYITDYEQKDDYIVMGVKTSESSAFI
jgi:hypothetical protein